MLSIILDKQIYLQYRF